MLTFTAYELVADRLCLGERTRGGLLRPTARTIPYSQITGALRVYLDDMNVHACGYLVADEGFNNVDTLTFAPRDIWRGVSKVPLAIEFLTNVKGHIFVSSVEKLPKNLEIALGAMRSSGFGHCKLKQTGEAHREIERGSLNTRLPLRLLDEFGVSVLQPQYGYLFRSIDRETGHYELSLFEKSLIQGPQFLVKETKYG